MEDTVESKSGLLLGVRELGRIQHSSKKVTSFDFGDDDGGFDDAFDGDFFDGDFFDGFDSDAGH